MRTITLVVILLLNFSNAEVYAASVAKKACVNSKGAIVIKSKCRKAEKLLSALTLNQAISTSQDAAGTAGPQGVIGVQGEVGSIGATGPQGIQGVSGSKGPKGQLDLSTCRVTADAYTTNFSNPSNPILYAEVFCNPSTEFLVEDESRVNSFPNAIGSRVALQGRFPYFQDIGGDVREYGVGIYANRFLVVGSGIIEFVVRAVCCPR